MYKYTHISTEYTFIYVHITAVVCGGNQLTHRPTHIFGNGYPARM